MTTKTRKAEAGRTEEAARPAQSQAGGRNHSDFSDASQVLLLQRTIGNRAVLGLLDPRGEDDQPGQALQDGFAPALSTAGPRIQRAPKTSGAQTEPGSSSVTQGSALLVEDSAASIDRGQMRKSEFLDQLRTSVCATADDALAKAGRSAAGCPYIEKWLSFYSGKPPAHIERALRKYAPETASAATARDYIPAVNRRVRAAVENWARTGEISGVPDEIKGLISGAGGGVDAIAGMIGQAVSGLVDTIGSALSAAVGAVGSLFSGIGRALFKRKDGAATETGDPEEIRGQLSGGQPLAGNVQSRMGSVFGTDFSAVRVHTGSQAAELSDGLNAKAFTVGSDIAFGSGEYQPGTLIGDALIAHELAHVAQQQHAEPGVATFGSGEESAAPYEEEADVAAAHAVAALHGGIQLRRPRSSLLRAPRLQSCGGSKPPQIRVPFGGSVSETQADQLLATDPIIGPRIKDRATAGTKAEGHTHELGTEDFVYTAYSKQYEGRENPRTKKEYTLVEAAYEVMNAGGYTIDGEIYLHRKTTDMMDIRSGGKSTPIPVPPSHHPATVVHEAVHLYGAKAWSDKVGRLGNEGVTEYFTRRVLSKQKNPEVEGGAAIFERDSYPEAFEAVKCLVHKADDELLADAYFLGQVDPLRSKVGAAAFDAWAAAMKKENYADAHAAVGCAAPVKKAGD